MYKNSLQITVLFEDPFWIGILERFTAQGYAVAKTIFGAEPTDNEAYYFLLTKFDNLRFSQPASIPEKPTRITNPKRKLREAQKLLQNSRSLSKAHAAIKQMQTQTQIVAKQQTKLQHDELQRRQYQLKQAKKKQKHRGH